MEELKAIVLVDNISSEQAPGEWGLSVYIEYRGKKILLDMGKSERFLKNSRKLDVDLTKVDFAVLSHAHYDHANGMPYFLEENDKACVYLREGSLEDCYHRRRIRRVYIGIKKGTLEKYTDRIRYVSGDAQISDGVSLIPHKIPGLDAVGKSNEMYRRDGKRWFYDDFSHEQSLVFETSKGLVIFNSCSHGGAGAIVREVQETYSGAKVYAIIGGFHLSKKSDAEVEAFVEGLKATGVEEVYTGHCTGDRAYEIIHGKMGEHAHQFKVGMEIRI